MNLITKYRIARALRKGIRLITIQTAIDEGYQKILSAPMTLDELCATAKYDPTMKEKVKLFLDALVSYDVVRRKTSSTQDTFYRWSRRSGHANEARDLRKKVDEILGHKFCGEILKGQHYELAKNWRHVIRGESDDQLSRAREMIALTVGLRAELMQEGRKHAIRFIGIKPGMSVVDLGCGAGTSTIQLAAAVGTQGYVVGVEVDENLYSEAVVRYQEMPVSQRKSVAEIEYIMGDAREKTLNKMGRDFDAATTFMFWHYIREDEYGRVIANISEVLKQNGRVGGMSPMHFHDDDIRDGEWAGITFPEFTNYPFLRKLRSVFREYGFGKFKLSKMMSTFYAMRD